MGMTKRRNIFIASALSGALGMISSAVAANAIIEDAKDRCIVGEQSDGYLGIVDDNAVDDALRREVRDINQQRKAFYADLAQKNGVSIDVTAALTAEKLITGAERGECVRGEDGAWVKV
jgi:uncharacterized protein YdbL (DUF1318 family)